MDIARDVTPRPLQGPAAGPADGHEALWAVVLIHGVGADGQDLIGLVGELSKAMPDAVFIAPDGPEPCDMAPVGRQWFSLADRDPRNMLAGVARARIDLDAFLDLVLERLALPASRLVLMGFSQGAMTALHVGLRRSVSPAGIIAMSGGLIAPEGLAAEIRCRPPVLLTHGSDDAVVSPDALAAARDGLAATGVEVDAHLIEGMGHGIDESVIALVNGFLTRIRAG
jgi:phospholipase/carboxylesterase